MAKPRLGLRTTEDLTDEDDYLNPRGVWLVKHYGSFTFGTCSPYKPHKTDLWDLAMALCEDVSFSGPPTPGRVLEKDKVEFIGRITINGKELD